MTIQYSHLKYEASHGARPKGRGSWAFLISKVLAKHLSSPAAANESGVQVEELCGELIAFIPGEHTLTDAKRILSNAAHLHAPEGIRYHVEVAP